MSRQSHRLSPKFPGSKKSPQSTQQNRKKSTKNHPHSTIKPQNSHAHCHQLDITGSQHSEQKEWIEYSTCTKHQKNALPIISSGINQTKQQSQNNLPVPDLSKFSIRYRSTKEYKKQTCHYAAPPYTLPPIYKTGFSARIGHPANLPAITCFYEMKNSFLNVLLLSLK